ncbi:hypothetical protein ALISP_0333 [Alicycliphilus sp. B1]|nr:hypothetical protein ALISP_0333 [Alicycliphilus sp. B1]
MNRRHYAISLHQATQESPTLARLTALTRDSSERLKAIDALIPPMLRPAIQAGPIEGDCWCLLVSSNAAAAKVRQLLPAFQAHLRSPGVGSGLHTPEDPEMRLVAGWLTSRGRASEWCRLSDSNDDLRLQGGCSTN